MATTASVPLEITVISAEVLKKKTKLFSPRMRLYTVLTLAGATVTRQMTPVDEQAGTRPVWNFPANFSLGIAEACQNGLVLVLQLRRKRVFGGDKDVGLAYVPVKELLENDTGRKQYVAYAMSSRSGKTKGVLYLSYMFVGSGTTTVTPSAPYIDYGHGVRQREEISTAIPSAPYIDYIYE